MGFESFSAERYSGREAEMDLLGEEVRREGRYDGRYKDFRESVELAKRNQPEYWNPEDPPVKPTTLPSDLHFFVERQLEAALERLSRAAPAAERRETERFRAFLQEGKLRFYDALGSHLDRLHGADSFFTLGRDAQESVSSGVHPRTDEVLVTLDLTENPEKAERGHKADVIVFVPRDVDYGALKPEEKGNLLDDSVKAVTHEILEKARRLAGAGARPSAAA